MDNTVINHPQKRQTKRRYTSSTPTIWHSRAGTGDRASRTVRKITECITIWFATIIIIFATYLLIHPFYMTPMTPKSSSTSPSSSTDAPFISKGPTTLTIHHLSYSSYSQAVQQAQPIFQDESQVYNATSAYSKAVTSSNTLKQRPQNINRTTRVHRMGIVSQHLAAFPITTSHFFTLLTTIAKSHQATITTRKVMSYIQHGFPSSLIS